jgi:MoxR-like ATPase
LFQLRALPLSALSVQVALEGRADAVTLANLMPKHWADFIRNSPAEDVKPIGTTPLRI